MIETKYLKVNDSMLNAVRSIPIFSEFSIQDLKKLVMMSKIRKFRPGEAICHEGTSDPWLFFLISGSVRISKKGKQLITLKTCGDIFGEMGAIDHSPRSATVRSIDHAVCMATDTSYIGNLNSKEMISFGLVIYRVFARILSDRLRQTNEELIKLDELTKRLTRVSRFGKMMKAIRRFTIRILTVLHIPLEPFSVNHKPAA